MNSKNILIDTCRLLGNYNGQNVYLYSSPKYDAPRLFYSPNYYYLPSWVQEPKKISFHQAIKIIEYRLKKKDMHEYAPASALAESDNDIRASGAGLPASAAKANARSRADDIVNA